MSGPPDTKARQSSALPVLLMSAIAMEPVTFLSLPRELRDNIYGYCKQNMNHPQQFKCVINPGAPSVRDCFVFPTITTHTSYPALNNASLSAVAVKPGKLASKSERLGDREDYFGLELCNKQIREEFTSDLHKTAVYLFTITPSNVAILHSFADVDKSIRHKILSIRLLIDWSDPSKAHPGDHVANLATILEFLKHCPHLRVVEIVWRHGKVYELYNGKVVSANSVVLYCHIIKVNWVKEFKALEHWRELVCYSTRTITDGTEYSDRYAFERFSRGGRVFWPYAA
ncbi:hypothetical protein EJ08DRAFT_701423 [Tothia fuscella]|uniref:Uncharacterized protein n=1 Tax=Tothia fuscella TaxID=1048955 RepID=A0A9P4TUJ7_9PEZI|nr:hypothetical protein EJ08DRAFT_701423 [Tothia fuscella]